MEMTLFLQKPNWKLAGKAAHAIFIGVGGTLLLIAFCAVFMNVYHIIKYLPLMIAFNTAMTGFSLIQKTEGAISHKHVAAVNAGLANVLMTLGILSVVSIYFTGENLIGTNLYLFNLAIGAGCSAFGAWLALKDLSRKEN